MADKRQQVEPTYPATPAKFVEPGVGPENSPQPPEKGAGWRPTKVIPNSQNPTEK